MLAANSKHHTENHSNQMRSGQKRKNQFEQKAVKLEIRFHQMEIAFFIEKYLLWFGNVSLSLPRSCQCSDLPDQWIDYGTLNEYQFCNCKHIAHRKELTIFGFLLNKVTLCTGKLDLLIEV